MLLLCIAGADLRVRSLADTSNRQQAAAGRALPHAAGDRRQGSRSRAERGAPGSSHTAQPAWLPPQGESRLESARKACASPSAMCTHGRAVPLSADTHKVAPAPAPMCWAFSNALVSNSVLG